MTPFELYDWLARVGFAGCLFVALLGSATRRFYWRWQYDEMRADLTKRIEELTHDLEEERHLARERERLSERVVGVVETNARRRGA